MCTLSKSIRFSCHYGIIFQHSRARPKNHEMLFAWALQTCFKRHLVQVHLLTRPSIMLSNYKISAATCESSILACTLWQLRTYLKRVKLMSTRLSIKKRACTNLKSNDAPLKKFNKAITSYKPEGSDKWHDFLPFVKSAWIWNLKQSKKNVINQTRQNTKITISLIYNKARRGTDDFKFYSVLLCSIISQ